MTAAQAKALAWVNKIRVAAGLAPLDDWPPNVNPHDVGATSRSLTCPIALALADVGVRGWAAGALVDPMIVHPDAFVLLTKRTPDYVITATDQFDREVGW